MIINKRKPKNRTPVQRERERGNAVLEGGNEVHVIIIIIKKSSKRNKTTWPTWYGIVLNTFDVGILHISGI